MIGITIRRLSIALLAQVVFCLVAAPILAAEQWAAPVVVTEKNHKPVDSGVKITPAFDASNVRPEEVSDAEQKRGKPHAGAGKAKGLAGTAPSPSAFKGEGWGEGEALTFGNDPLTQIGTERAGTKTFDLSTLDPHPSPLPEREREQERAVPEASPDLKSPRESQPAFQPTGPPRV